MSNEKQVPPASDLPYPLPPELTPVNIKCYLEHAFGACGCWEYENFLRTLYEILVWHENKEKCPYSDLFMGDKGVFYFIAGQLDRLGLAEHGTSIRYSWLTPEGERFLSGLRATNGHEILNAEGPAWDGVHY